MWFFHLAVLFRFYRVLFLHHVFLSEQIKMMMMMMIRSTMFVYKVDYWDTYSVVDKVKVITLSRRVWRHLCHLLFSCTEWLVRCHYSTWNTSVQYIYFQTVPRTWDSCWTVLSILNDNDIVYTIDNRHNHYWFFWISVLLSILLIVSRYAFHNSTPFIRPWFSKIVSFIPWNVRSGW